MSIDGDWKVTINSPMGAQEGTLTLDSSGGDLTGTMAAPQGTETFSGGTVDGNKLTWTLKMTSPMPMDLDFEVTVNGDDLEGKVKLGAFGDAAITGSRA